MTMKAMRSVKPGQAPVEKKGSGAGVSSLDEFEPDTDEMVMVIVTKGTWEKVLDMSKRAESSPAEVFSTALALLDQKMRG